MQDDINMYVTPDRLNYMSSKRKLRLIAKNIFRRKNLLEIVFKDISTFQVQNAITGPLLKELNIGKKRYREHFNKKAPNLNNIEFNQGLILI